MSTDATNTLETKIKELEETIKKTIESLNEIEENIKKLNNDRATIVLAIKEMNGALVAYKESVRVLKGPEQESPVVHELEPVN